MPDAITAESGPGVNCASEVPRTEMLYRRLLPAAWYRTLPVVIPQRYFMPRPWRSDENRGDVDGISVNRASLTDAIAASRRPDTGECVPMAQFAASEVYDIGLTVRPDPLPNDRSHATIPELNSRDRRDGEEEKKMEEWAMALRNSSTLITPQGS